MRNEECRNPGQSHPQAKVPLSGNSLAAGGFGRWGEDGSQRVTSMASWAASDVLRRADRYNLPALVAGVGAEINDPVGGLHHVEVVLDDQHRVAGIHKPLEDLEQHAHVVKVQPGRRLVEKEQRSSRRKEVLLEFGARSAELRMPARVRRGRLPTIASARCRTSFSRWLSPPERVLIGWPSRR